MKKLDLTRRLVLVTMLMLLLPASLRAASRNILLIIADDYGADSSSLYNSTNGGASLPPTPNIEALARSGVVFRNAYANPVCSPTRACLITGRYGFRTGIGDVVTGPGGAVLTASEFTLPEAFAANGGYQLAQFGKWHLNNLPNSPATIGGWPHFAGGLVGAVASYTNWTKLVNGSSTPNYTNYTTTDVVNDAIDWIQARTHQPWFAWVAFNAPHAPLHKPPSSLCPHYAFLPGTQPDINARPRLYYEAMTEAMDTEIGRLLNAVDRTNTHIVFLGDNGTPAQVIQPPHTSTKAKNTVYEGGVKVPLIISGPTVANPGRRNDTLVHAVDLFATILEMAGMDISATVPTNVMIDSQSVLAAAETESNIARFVYVEKFGSSTPSPDARALRNARFKLIQFTETGTEEFYDLLADPTEKTNLLSGTLTGSQLGEYYSLEMRLGLYQNTLNAPTISSFSLATNRFSATVLRTTNNFRLWQAETLGDLAWAPIADAMIVTNGASVTLTHTNATSAASYYRVEERVR
jgi:arylsulfatase A-like enzyme